MEQASFHKFKKHSQQGILCLTQSAFCRDKHEGKTEPVTRIVFCLRLLAAVLSQALSQAVVFFHLVDWAWMFTAITVNTLYLLRKN